jgi:hypothetical protein
MTKIDQIEFQTALPPRPHSRDQDVDEAFGGVLAILSQTYVRNPGKRAQQVERVNVLTNVAALAQAPSQHHHLGENPRADALLQGVFGDQVDLDADGVAEILFETDKLHESDRVAEFHKDVEIAVLLLRAAHPGAKDAHLANRIALPQLRLKAAKLGHDLVKRAQIGCPVLSRSTYT